MVDKVDEKILSLLEDNSRMSYVDIARSVNLSEGAVRNRVQNLLDQGVIKRFTIERGVGVALRALTMIAVNPSVPTIDVSRLVQALDGVERLYEVTGEYDIVMVSGSANIEGINGVIEEIRMIPGVEKTNTIIVLRTI